MWKFTPEKLRKLQLQKAERELLEAEYLLEHYQAMVEMLRKRTARLRNSTMITDSEKDAE